MKYIGIKLADGSFYPILQKGTQAKKTLDLTTVKDNQTTVQIDLYGSDTGTMEGAEYVDTLEIRQLEPHPNGEPDLQLEVSLDEKDNLHAQILDPETGKSSQTQIVISKAVSERNTSETQFNTDDETAAPKVKDTFAEDMKALEEDDFPPVPPAEDTFDRDMKAINELSFGEGDDGSSTLNLDELAQLGQNTKLSLEEEEVSSDTQIEESMIGPSVNDETFTFEDSEVPAVSAESGESVTKSIDNASEAFASSVKEAADNFAQDVKEAASAFSSELDQTTDSITEAMSKAEDKLTDTMNSISDTLNDFSSESVEESAPEEASSQDTDFDLPDFSALEESNTESSDFDMPDFSAEESSSTESSSDFDMPDFDNLDATGSSDMTEESSSSDDFDLPDFGDIDMTTGDSDMNDFSEAAAVSRAATSDDDFSMPDFGDTNSVDEPETTFAPTGGLDFNGLYDKETLEGDSSYNDDEVAETVKKKTKVPVLICIICAIICIIAAILVLFVIPSRINLLTRDSYKKKSEDARAQIEAALAELPEPADTEPEEEILPPEPVEIVTPVQEVIVPQEDVIVVAENPETVVPDKPVASAEKAEDIRYKIKWGDTLWDIADAYYKNPWKYKNIARYNGIKNPDYIISGTWILIPAE